MKGLIIHYCLIFIYCALAQQINIEDEVSNNTIPPPLEQTDSSSTVPDVVTSNPNQPTGLINWITTRSDMLKNKLSLGAQTLNKAINIGNNSMHLAASMGSSVANEGTDFLKQGVKKATSLGLRGIDNSVDIAHQILELMEVMPGIGLISRVGKTGVNVAGNVGKNTLNGLSRFKKMKLDFINNLAQRGSNALTNFANVTSGIGQTIISGGTNAIKDGIDTGVGVINRVVTGFENLRALGNRLSNSLTSAGESYIAPRNIIQTPPRQ
uniref:Secreted Hemolysin-like protein n=1 Tax=Pristhesancus plagipennis TaxID=1955184 RepID=A0A2K8JPD7_PRIPG|nr:secreted Hemolysin-like protein [Pristhesancus plagipennis]